ncbi:MAG: PAS domain-containing protein [Candidatus Syntrophopropionicum ammoniitolerans]
MAVYRGHAEPQMCIPYMRKRAESISNQVLTAMPNAVIIVNEDLIVTEINPAALKMFDPQSRQIIGQQLDRFIDPGDFQLVLREKKAIVSDFCILRNRTIARQIVFPVENMVVGIFADITKEINQQEELLRVKTQTIDRAREVIKKLMTVSQEIAGLLGETTAETKILLNQLIKLMQE